MEYKQLVNMNIHVTVETAKQIRELSSEIDEQGRKRFTQGEIIEKAIKLLLANP